MSAMAIAITVANKIMKALSRIANIAANIRNATIPASGPGLTTYLRWPPRVLTETWI
jgi:hypothetical protein